MSGTTPPTIEPEGPQAASDTSSRNPEISRPLFSPETGSAIAEALDRDREWRLRKVDSVWLLDGRADERRCSIDMIPPFTEALVYRSLDSDTDSSKPGTEKGLRHLIGRCIGLARDAPETQGSRQVIVPIAQMAKGAVRSFSLFDEQGQVLAHLTKDENTDVASAATIYQLAGVDGFNDHDLTSRIRQVVESPACDATRQLAEDIAKDVIDKASADDAKEMAFGIRLLFDLADNFLVLALLPERLTRQRTVVKYRYHWEAAILAERSWRLWKTAYGFDSHLIEIDLAGPADARSYHLEVLLPQGLTSAGVALPPLSSTTDHHGFVDNRPGSVGHVVGNYPTPPDLRTAQAHVRVPNRGLRPLALLVSTFTFVFFLLERVLWGAHEVMLRQSGGGAALLLAVPAVALALLARPGENQIAGTILLPLRLTILGCSGLLMAGAASLVGQLWEPYMSILWWFGCGLSGIATAFLFVGLLPSRAPK